MIDFDSLNEVFVMVFQDPEIRISADTTADDIDGWDSLSHVILISAIEDKYQITFTQREILRFRCVGDMLNCINQKLS
ncbi:MAG: acyl carrier protein [Anaerolineaceae bacterium]|jgi:acyl carrier protein|nr:acyl carrier protein [Anaerolineaceae bacterium]